MKKISTFLWVLMALLALPQATGAQTFDTEVDNIAAFIAAEDGKTVKLTLTDARVNAFNDLSSTYYVEDATGAVAVKGIALTKGTKLNGYVIGVKNTEDVDYINTPSQGLEYQLTVDGSASEFTATATELAGTEMTIIEACQQANYGKLITVSNVDVTALGNGKNKQLADANGNTIKARDLFGVLPSDYTWPAKATKVTGVALYYMTGWFIIPISEEAIVEYVQPTEVTFDFTTDALRGYLGTSLTDNKGYIYNETYTVDETKLQITAGSAQSRICVNTKGKGLVMFKEYSTLTFKAPDGYAITNIAFTTATGTSIDFTASAGTLTGTSWEGNAEAVRFLNNATPYIENAVVTLAEKDTETTPLPALEYTECANIAAFNALSVGTYAKVTLTDAEVVGISADGISTAFIQDATGGCWMQYTSLNADLKEKTKLNGYVYTVARSTAGNMQIKEAEDTPKSEITATDITDYTMVEGTLSEVNIAANKNKVVKITGATVTETSATAGTLTQGGSIIDINNGTATANQQLHKIAEWANGTTLENVTVVAILVGKSNTANQLLPISITDETATAITDIKAAEDAGNVVIYNLQGVRLNKLQKGINIVNGKKIVIK